MTRLEITWIVKIVRPKPDPGILLEDPVLSCHAVLLVSGADIFNGMLIQGGNLLALKALEAEHTGEVTRLCIHAPVECHLVRSRHRPR
jgi:adenine-specific DNA-methyltransferase